MGRRCALFTGDGRLGNQLFEAAFLDGILQPGDRLFATGMEEFLNGFDWERVAVRNREDTYKRRGFKRWLRRLGRMAVALRLVDGIGQTKQDFASGERHYLLHGSDVVQKRGIFSRFLYVDKGYFQSAEFAGEPSFRLKDEHKAAARAFLARLPAGPRAFIHVRRGDYRHWKIFDRSPLLPMSYYLRGIEIIKAAAPDTQFILLSDEVEAATAELGLSGLHVFSGQNVYEDLAMMTLCDGGIISNSTLSWWGGYFCGRKLPLISPRGWLATGLGFEYPAGITGPWMTPIEP